MATWRGGREGRGGVVPIRRPQTGSSRPRPTRPVPPGIPSGKRRGGEGNRWYDRMDQARSAARLIAAEYTRSTGRQHDVVHDPRHGPGQQPHFHIAERGTGRRIAGHFFYSDYPREVPIRPGGAQDYPTRAQAQAAANQAATASGPYFVVQEDTRRNRFVIVDQATGRVLPNFFTYRSRGSGTAPAAEAAMYEALPELTPGYAGLAGWFSGGRTSR